MVGKKPGSRAGELKMLCIRAKNALHYVAQRFMWRSLQNARKDAPFGADKRRII
jgi:hypothetical protein